MIGFLFVAQLHINIRFYVGNLVMAHIQRMDPHIMVCGIEFLQKVAIIFVAMVNRVDLGCPRWGIRPGYRCLHFVDLTTVLAHDFFVC